MGARRVEPPVRKPPRKNQSYDGRLTGPTPSDSARRDLSISAIKKISTIFDLTTAPAPYEKDPQLGKKATHDGADSAIRRPPRSLSARRRRRNFWPGSAAWKKAKVSPLQYYDSSLSRACRRHHFLARPRRSDTRDRPKGRRTTR